MFTRNKRLEKEFKRIINKHGECVVYYINGCYLHYVLRNSYVCEYYDYNKTIYGLSNIEAENLFTEYICLENVKLISNKIKNTYNYYEI